MSVSRYKLTMISLNNMTHKTPCKSPNVTFFAAPSVFAVLAAFAVLALSAMHYAKSAELTAQYDLDLLKNTQGGISTKFDYIDLLSLSVSDTHSFNRESQLSYFVSAFYSNGHAFSEDIVGDDHVVSNLEGGAQFAKLGEAWVDYQYQNLSILFGLYDINSEFDVLQSANLFINSGHGIGNDIGLSGRNGPSIYPYYGLSARIKLALNSHHTLLIAAIDGSPGDASTPSAPAISLSSDDGVFSIAQWQYENADHIWLLGAWHYTKSQALTSDTRFERARSGNWGAYVRHEQSLFTEVFQPQIKGFFRLGISDSEFNKYDGFVSAGINVSQVSGMRRDDSFGAAVAYTDLGDDFARVNANTVDGFANGELNIELTYRTRLHKYVFVQPTVQYIKHPAGIEQDSALVAGLRLSLQFAH
ncbi:carbohydrate porin [Glaciecola siphonariae]|uniref:Carbohydrate porin n=1 Tax=Glaciecola siphonariae TaxID=521012 RepID=A0ABV9M097_9ALTE